MRDLPNILKLLQLYNNDRELKTNIKITLVLTRCTERIKVRWQHRGVHDLWPHDQPPGGNGSLDHRRTRLRRRP